MKPSRSRTSRKGIMSSGEQIQSENEFQKSGIETFFGRHSTFAKLFSAVLYCSISTSMAFLNKILMTKQEFTCIYFMLTMQMLVTIFALHILQMMKLISLPAFSVNTSLNFFLASGTFACHAVLSLDALRGMDIPMYGAIKRCTPLVTMILSTLILKKPIPSKLTVTSIVAITVGCFMAGFGEVEFKAHAYVMGGLAVIAQACYLTFIQMSAEAGISTMGILQMNSYNNFPVFLLLSLLTGEGNLVKEQLQDYSSLVFFVLTVTFGAVLNFTLFLCTALNDALTTTLVNVFKSVLQTAIGEIFFTDAPRTPLFLSGIGMNLFGGVGYVWAKYKKSLTQVKIGETSNT